MKLVIGIVRPEKTNDVLEALYRAEVRGLTMTRVEGHGGELDRVETYRGTTVKVGLADKVRFEIAVSDAFVEPTITALCKGGQTGEVGDGVASARRRDLTRGCRHRSTSPRSTARPDPPERPATLHDLRISAQPARPGTRRATAAAVLRR